MREKGRERNREGGEVTSFNLMSVDCGYLVMGPSSNTADLHPFHPRADRDLLVVVSALF